MWVVVLGQAGHQVLADFVAGEPPHVVAAVLPVGAPNLPAVFGGLVLGHIKQGPEKFQATGVGWPGPIRDFAHSAEAVQAGPTQHVEQHRLRQVIRRMAHGHCPGAGVGGNPGHERVPHLPGALFKRRDTPHPLILVGVFFYHGHRQTQFFGDLSHEHGVVLGFLAPEVVVQVGDVKGKAVGLFKPVQGVQQGTGIRASGRADDQSCTRVGVAGPPEGGRHLAFQFGGDGHNRLRLPVFGGQVAGEVKPSEAAAPVVAIEGADRSQVQGHAVEVLQRHP